MGTAMRLLQWAWLGLTSLAAAADTNTTHESRNILPATFKPPPHFRNVNLVRNINLEKSYPRETINVVVETVDAQPHREYYLPFEQGTLGRIGGLEAKDKKEPERSGFTAEIVEVDPYSSTEYYKITFPSALPSKEQITLQITYYVLSALEPLPAHIGQLDKQYVLHTFSAYVPSAYTTLKQKTKLKLPTVDVPDVTTLPADLNAEGKEDPQKQGTTFTYGPYGEREAGATQEASVRYEFTRPLTHGKLLERDVEVSHWGGNIATEERHWLTNRAAALKNQFSRVQYQQSAYYNPPTHALKNYLRHVKGGGSDSYILNVPFFEGPKQAEGVEYERVVTRIILPEGADNVRFQTSVPLVSNTTSLHRTFMDTIGRTTLTLTALNVVDEFRDRDLLVTYDLPFSARFIKPLTISAGMLVVFALSWVVGNLDVSIGGKKKTA